MLHLDNNAVIGCLFDCFIIYRGSSGGGGIKRLFQNDFYQFHKRITQYEYLKYTNINPRYATLVVFVYALRTAINSVFVYALRL